MAEHAKSGFCQACWDAAYMRMLAEPSKSQSEHYAELVKQPHAEEETGETEDPINRDPAVFNHGDPDAR